MPDRRPAGRAAGGRAASAGDCPAVTVRRAVASAAHMRLLGRRLAGLLRRGDLVVLAGALGAGKTTLAAGIGTGLGVRGPVTSPTFVIARLHPSLGGGPDLVHADGYRLGSRLEADDLDLDADLDHSVTVVEWGEGLVESLASGYLLVTIDRPDPWPAPGQGPGQGGADGPDGSDESDDELRTVTAAGFGARWAAAADQLRAALAGQA
jgi:tRNA threonylcarbamoyladenosine biosynthesis protein TsaE